MALAGLVFIVYLSCQVSEEQLNAGIPFPQLATDSAKTTPIPDVKASATEKPPAIGGVPAYAQFYNTKSGEEEKPDLGKPRPRQRPKPAKRHINTVKPKKSS